MTSLSYHHTSRLTNPVAEKLGKMLVGDRPGGLSHAVFLSSGSEANETAIKLARQYYVEIGEPERVHIISRNNSYHGNSIGCVSLTGIPVSEAGSGQDSIADQQNRRRHFEPILMPHTSRVSPCYAYRYKREVESEDMYAQRLADELELERTRWQPSLPRPVSQISTRRKLLIRHSRGSGSWQPYSRAGVLQGYPPSL
jgi:adenosylmethionine-8-amino-7-oxononanoate aminotransferase